MDIVLIEPVNDIYRCGCQIVAFDDHNFNATRAVRTQYLRTCRGPRRGCPVHDEVLRSTVTETLSTPPPTPRRTCRRRRGGGQSPPTSGGDRLFSGMFSQFPHRDVVAPTPTHGMSSEPAETHTLQHWSAVCAIVDHIASHRRRRRVGNVIYRMTASSSTAPQRRSRQHQIRWDDLHVEVLDELAKEKNPIFH